MNKKGVEMAITIVVSLIIFIIISFVLIDWVYSAPKKLCNGEVSACRAGILAAYLKESFFQESQPPCHQTSYVFETESPEVINAIIALELEKCVVKFNEGRLDLGKGGTGWFSSDLVCFVCSEFDIKGKAKENYIKANSQGNNFMGYVRENKVKCSYPKVTFSEYFSEINKLTREGKRYLIIERKTNDIDPETRNIIVFSVLKEGKAGQFLANFGETEWLVTAASVVGWHFKLFSEFLDFLGLDKKKEAIQLVTIGPAASIPLERCDFVFR